ADRQSIALFQAQIQGLVAKGSLQKLQQLSQELHAGQAQAGGIAQGLFAKEIAIVDPALAKGTKAKQHLDSLTGAQLLNAQAAGKFGHAQQVAAKHTQAVAKAAQQTSQSFLTFGQDVSNAKVSLDDWIKDLDKQARALTSFATNSQKAADR